MRKNVAVILAVMIIATISVWRLTARWSAEHQVSSRSRPEANENLRPRPAGGGFVTEQQISLKDLTREEAQQAWWQRRERDKQADWKVPIRFYGRVVDQDMHPVSGANVLF